jgi:hypothetical protein
MIMANFDWAQHIRRVQNADYTTYPLLVIGDNQIVDGMHRLTKAWIDQVPEVTIRKIANMPAEAEITDNDPE